MKRLVCYYKSLSILKKFLLPSLLGLVFFIPFYIYLLLNTSYIQNDIQSVNIKLLPLQETAYSNKIILDKISSEFNSAVISNEIEWIKNTKENYSLFLKNFDVYKAKNSFYKKEIEELEDSFKEYYEVAYKTSANLIQTNSNYAEIHKDTLVLVQKYNTLQNKVDTLISNIKEHIEQNVKKSYVIFDNVLLKSLYMFMLWIVLSFFIIYFIYQDFSSKILQIVKESEKIAQGEANFTKRLNFSSDDELGKVIESFNIFIEKLYNNHTELKKTKEELEIQKEKAETATKVKSEFLANMSHEIRTPMNCILGTTYLALEKDLDDKTTKYIQDIDMSAKGLLTIIDDILDFSKIEANKLKIEKITFNIFNTIESTLNMLKVKADEKSLPINIVYSKSIKNYYIGDPTRLSQILYNLVGNAIKFTDEGEISIYIDKASENHLHFEVKDTGIGLSKVECENLFEPFRQVDGSINRIYGGTGLGLSICKKLAELMNGKIWVESQKNVGSKFIFEIELVENKVKQVAQIKEQIDPIPTISIDKIKDSKVLLVEDNKANQMLIVEILENCDLIVDIANNGKEALDAFKEKDYDIILMDIQMPKMNGLEVTKEIRKVDTNIPIIALTANTMPEEIDEIYNVGMNDYINKPINFKRFKSILLSYISSKNS